MKDKDIVEAYSQITNVLFKDDIVPAIFDIETLLNG